MQLVAKCTIPLFLPSESNLREHWGKKHRRHVAHRNAVFCLFSGPTRQDVSKAGLPVLIKLIRRSRRKLDHDNLISAFKHIRDSIADVLIPGRAPGRADNVKGLYWRYAQCPGSPSCVVLEFYKLSNEQERVLNELQ